jgi:hypothetical protein
MMVKRKPKTRDEVGSDSEEVSPSQVDRRAGRRSGVCRQADSRRPIAWMIFSRRGDAVLLTVIPDRIALEIVVSGP